MDYKRLIAFGGEMDEIGANEKKTPLKMIVIKIANFVLFILNIFIITYLKL